MYVLPEQKLNSITNAHCFSFRPTCTKPNVEPTPPVKIIHQIRTLPYSFTFKTLNYAKKMSTVK